MLDGYHANGKDQSKTAKHFNSKWPELDVTQYKVSDWIKKEKDIQELYFNSPAMAES